MAAHIAEPKGVFSIRSKAILNGLGCGEEGQSLKANLWETDWKSKSWNQSALFYSQDGELEQKICKHTDTQQEMQKPVKKDKLADSVGSLLLHPHTALLTGKKMDVAGKDLATRVGLCLIVADLTAVPPLMPKLTVPLRLRLAGKPPFMLSSKMLP